MTNSALEAWAPFNGTYEKVSYDVRLPDGTIVPYCWPNAGFLNAMDGSGDQWGPGQCQFRPSAIHPMDDPNPDCFKRWKPT